MGKRETKQAVANELLSAAGTMIEFWTQRFEDLGEEPPCDAQEASKMVAHWLKKLPGDEWNNMLPKVWEED